MTLREILKKMEIPIKKVADALGIHPNNIARYDDLSKRSIDDLLVISSAVDINLSELIGLALDERTEELKEQNIKRIHFPKYIEKTEAESTVLLYNVEAAANLKTLLADKNQNILGKINIPNIPKCDGAVYVRGDSMYPLLKSGDIIAYKEIGLNMQNVIYGEMYLISIDMEGDEYISVKYVHHSDRGDKWIKLVSYNSHHEPKDFPLSSVRAMALVKFSIRMNTIK